MTNKEVISQYGNNVPVVEELMVMLLLKFKEDPSQNTVSLVKNFLKEETMCDSISYYISTESNMSVDTIDIEYKEL